VHCVCPSHAAERVRDLREPCMHAGPMLTSASAAGAMAVVLALLGLLSLTTSPVLVRGGLLTWVAVACHLHATWLADGAEKDKICLLAGPALHTPRCVALHTCVSAHGWVC